MPICCACRRTAMQGGRRERTGSCPLLNSSPLQEWPAVAMETGSGKHAPSGGSPPLASFPSVSPIPIQQRSKRVVQRGQEELLQDSLSAPCLLVADDEPTVRRLLEL